MHSPVQKKTSKIILWLILAASILFVATVRIRLLDMPLERDEGEYAYAGQLMLEGTPPYQLAYNMKLPGAYVAYALIMSIFGKTIAGIHWGLLIVNISTSVLMFFLAKRIIDFAGAVIAASLYSLLSLSPAMFGMAGHATHFVLLPAVAGLYLLLRALERNEKPTLFLSGLLFGLAFLMKQHGVFFGLFGGLYLAGFELKRRPVSWRQLIKQGLLYSSGAILPFGLVCLWLYGAGVFITFWFWNFSYAQQYVSQVSPALAGKQFHLTFTTVLTSGLWLWILAGIGTIILLLRWKAYKCRYFLTGILLFSFLSICPGFHFREHYFLLLLPAISLLAGLAVSWGLSKDRTGAIILVLFIIACGHAVYGQKELFFHLSPAETSRAVYGVNPFPEAIKIAEYIKQNTSENATIAILGSEPEIYFYANRKSASGYIYMYGLMEPQAYAIKMQKQMIEEIEASKPDSLVFINIATSWLIRPQSSRLVFNWFNHYVKENFELVGQIEILPEEETTYLWDLQEPASPQSLYYIMIYTRRPTSKIQTSRPNTE